jgi:predicted ATPase
MTALRIRTPDQRLRVFVSSTLQELAPERAAAQAAITAMRMTPVLFEAGARPYPPRELYQAYLAQSDIFIGIYWERYGWVAADMVVSGLEDEYVHAAGKHRLLYIKEPASRREPGLARLLARIRGEGSASYQRFATAAELQERIENDLAVLVSERFGAPAPGGEPGTGLAPAAVGLGLTLPARRPALVGREREVAAVRALVCGEGTGLVTLTGPGGVGKTALALAVAHELAGAFPDGVGVVPLEAVTDPEQVLPAVAQALGVQPPSTQPLVEGLQLALSEQRILLILDNVEQVVGAAPDIAALLAACPRLVLLVTSRTPLRLRGEREVPVVPLAVPDPSTGWTAETLAHYAAVALFIARAREIDPTFAVTDETAPAIAAICSRLDGLPLAIELAAARTRLLAPPALLARLEPRLPLLRGGYHDLPARQRTMEGAIGWSYDLLGEREQRLVRCLAIFRGGWSLAAAAQVCAEAGDDDGLEALEELVAQSLVRVGATAEGEPRFWMLQVIHEYASRRLEEAGEREVRAVRHAAYCADLAEQVGMGSLHGKAWLRWLTTLDPEQDNLRAALAWATSQGDACLAMRMVAALPWYWVLRGRFDEGARWSDLVLVEAPQSCGHRLQAGVLLTAALMAWKREDHATARRHVEASVRLHRLGDEPALLALALTCAGVIATSQMELTQAAAYQQESVALFRTCHDTWGIGMALANLGDVHLAQRDWAEATARYTESLDIFTQLEDPWGQGIVLQTLGHVDRAQGEAERARERYAASVALLQRIGNRDDAARGLIGLAAATLAIGDAVAAEGHLVESLGIWRDLGNAGGIALCLAGLAAVTWALDQRREAARLLGAAEAMGYGRLPLYAVEGDVFSPWIQQARAALKDHVLAEAWAEGQAAPVEELMETILAQADTSDARDQQAEAAVGHGPYQGAGSNPRPDRHADLARSGGGS